MNWFYKRQTKSPISALASAKGFQPNHSEIHNDFYEEARNWHYDKYESQKVWLNRAVLAIGILSIFLLVSLLLNAMLFPLKEKIPFLYAVNENTGELTQIGQFRPEQWKQHWLMTRFLLIRYVINRESYDADNLDRPYQIAWAMSDNAIARDYASQVDTSNPQSQFSLFGKTKFITVHVLSVNKLNNNTADVRFEATLHDKTNQTQQMIEKETIIKWKYTHPVTTQKMLDRDPLGFQVTYYQPTQVNISNTNINTNTQ